MPAAASVPVWFWVFSAFMFGAIFGSFVNMAAYRLPRNISTITRTRSFCPVCNHQLAWYDNFPILSYLSLFGRCRYCQAGIPMRYLLVELIVAALFALAAYQYFGLNAAGGMPWIVFAVQLFLIVDLVLLSVVDLEVWLIPVQTTILWIPVGLLLAVIFPELHASATVWTGSPRLDAFIDSASGLILGAGLLWGIGFAVLVLTFIMARARGGEDRPKEGMGLGDVHLMGMVGAFLGWKQVLAALFFGVIIGAVTGVAGILWGKFQQRRLGDQYKPNKPVYELPPAEEYQPQFWWLALFGVLVLLLVGYLQEQSARTFNLYPAPTAEEQALRFKHMFMIEPKTFDMRMVPVWLMGAIGVALILAFPFMLYLQKMNLLPQGEIVEKDGKKEEVLEGNYIPFGPSLAAGALLVAFYDPLIRNFAFWFAVGATGPFPPLPYRVIAEAAVLQVLLGLAKLLPSAAIEDKG